ncbi:MAG: hypothetical protein ACM4D3_08140 [Candidatus Sericytochromatia bacterium]
MKNRIILGTGVVAATLAIGAIAYVPSRGVDHTITARDGCETAQCPGGTIPLPPGGPETVYPRDQSVGGANPFVPFGTNPLVPFGTWHGLQY